MTVLDLVVVALIQAIAEILPLGASGHLALFLPSVDGNTGRAAATVAAHAGIVLALMVYFWRELAGMAWAPVKMAKGKRDADTRLLGLMLAGTIPAALAIAAILYLVPASTLGPRWVAGLMIGFGLLMLLADQMGVTVRRIEHMGVPEALAIGLIQILALVPGVSRTGITLTLARLLGYERHDAARYSLLLAIPLLLAHGGMTAWDLARQGVLIYSWDMARASALAFVVTLITIIPFLAWLRHHSLTPFALWRLGAGVAAIALMVLR